MVGLGVKTFGIAALLLAAPPTIPGDDVPTPEVPHDEDFRYTGSCHVAPPPADDCFPRVGSGECTGGTEAPVAPDGP